MEPLYLNSVDPLTKAPGMLVALRVLDYHTVSRACATSVLVSTHHVISIIIVCYFRTYSFIFYLTIQYQGECGHIEGHAYILCFIYPS